MNALALLAFGVALLPAQTGQLGGFGGASNAPQLPDIRAKVNEAFDYNGLRYTITSVKDGLKSYTERFDQRELKLSPGFKTESLVVFEVVVENLGSKPAVFSSIIPALTYGDGSVTDHVHWDVEQRSLVRKTSEDRIGLQDHYVLSYDPVQVAPNGRAHFAIAFSHPSRSKATQLSFVPGVTFVSSGVLVTHEAAGQAAIIVLG